MRALLFCTNARLSHAYALCFACTTNNTDIHTRDVGECSLRENGRWALNDAHESLCFLLVLPSCALPSSTDCQLVVGDKMSACDFCQPFQGVHKFTAHRRVSCDVEVYQTKRSMFIIFACTRIARLPLVYVSPVERFFPLDQPSWRSHSRE